jgi:CheY-like chemotaxis protein
MANILLVEDDESSRRYLALVLKQLGHEVRAVAGGQQALDEIESRGCPDAVVSDLVMPGMDGNELIEELRKREADCMAPVFFMLYTGQPTVSTVVSAVTRGADEVLIKPLDISKLAKALERVTRHE